jgi:hypothetical protein
MNVQQSTNHELASKSMAIIAEELDSLHSGAAHLQGIYSQAAITSDLTFIKILEEKYENLMNELNKLGEVVSTVKVNLAKYATEVEENGG